MESKPLLHLIYSAPPHSHNSRGKCPGLSLFEFTKETKEAADMSNIIEKE